MASESYIIWKNLEPTLCDNIENKENSIELHGANKTQNNHPL